MRIVLQIKLASRMAGVSTASMGKFDKRLEGEKDGERNPLGKRRKFMSVRAPGHACACQLMLAPCQQHQHRWPAPTFQQQLLACLVRHRGQTFCCMLSKKTFTERESTQPHVSGSGCGSKHPWHAGRMAHEWDGGDALAGCARSCCARAGDGHGRGAQQAERRGREAHPPARRQRAGHGQGAR